MSDYQTIHFYLGKKLLILRMKKSFKINFGDIHYKLNYLTLVKNRQILRLRNKYSYKIIN